ncbi:MAG: hypothetical protein AAF940_14350 [Pseudomonadota bacterium]
MSTAGHQLLFELVLNLLGVPAEHHQEAVRGFLGFIGIFVTGVFAVLAWVARWLFERREKRRDAMQALRAEIRAVWMHLRQTEGNSAVDFERKKIIAELENAAANSNYTPAIVHADGILVYPYMLDKISVLPENEIVYVVDFYRQMELLREFAALLSAPAFSGYSPERKLSMLRYYWAMNGGAFDKAKLALDWLEWKLDIPWSQKADQAFRRSAKTEK